MSNEFTNKNQVGGVDRPPRPVTLGRRRSDRILAYMTIALMIGMGVFIVYTSWQQNRSNTELERSERDRAIILERVECLAAGTYAFEDAVGQYLVQPNMADTPERRAALDELRRLQEFRRQNPPPETSRCKTVPPPR